MAAKKTTRKIAKKATKQATKTTAKKVVTKVVKKASAAKTSTAKKSVAKASVTKAPATTQKKLASKKSAAKKPAARPVERRADFGGPVDGFFAKQPPHMRAILGALRQQVEDAAPDAEAGLKWGMPFYSVNGVMMCGLAAHKAHVNVVLSGPASAFDDPDGLLLGEGATGRHLKLTSLDQLPAKALAVWLRTAADLARQKA